MNPLSAKRLQTRERFLDVTLSAFGLVVLAPVFAGIALAIILDDGRPVFFSQTRVGKNGKLFRLWKFRTMRSGSPGDLITVEGDRRITRAGAKLRRFKLDELPQLFNVLKGDMSLIGPRPEVPEYVRMEVPMWQAVLGVRPGITDLATLLYRDEAKILSASGNPNSFYRDNVLPAKLVLNIDYLLSRSFWKDLKLIYLTVHYSIFSKNLDSDFIRRTFSAGGGNE